MFAITSLTKNGSADMSVEFKTKYKEVYTSPGLWISCSPWGYEWTILKPLSMYTGNKQISRGMEDMGARDLTVGVWDNTKAKKKARINQGVFIHAYNTEK